jgi:hypothetical protein
MRHYANQAILDIGKPAGGATITVMLAGTQTKAAIYSDDGVTVKSNPFSADSLGHFDFCAPSGKYDINIAASTGITGYAIPNEVVFDPFEQSAADTGVVVKNLSVSGQIVSNLSVATGQVLSADQIVPINSSGVGSIILPVLTIPAQENTTSTFPANVVRVCQFTLPYAFTIGKVAVTIANGAAGTADVGIYTSSGNKVLNTGGFSTAASATVSVPTTPAPVTLAAGVYYFAAACSSGIPQFVAIGTTNWETQINASSTKVGTAANAASNGVLPQTLGAITSGSFIFIYATFER